MEIQIQINILYNFIQTQEMWETRKRIQQQRMEEETRILQKEQKEREKSITNRENVFNEQTARMQGNKVTNGNIHNTCLYIRLQGYIDNAYWVYSGVCANLRFQFRSYITCIYISCCIRVGDLQTICYSLCLISLS